MNTKKVYIFLADGFEDIEGLMVVDLMRRAEIDITTVSVMDTKEIHTSHGITMFADRLYGEDDYEQADMLVLPGGKKGTANLKAFEPLRALLKKVCSQGRKIAAICAAPTMFSDLGLLKDRKATCYPSLLDTLDCRERSEENVVVDGNITTSRGLGTSLDFALCMIGQLISPEKAEEIAFSVAYKK